MNVLLLSTSDIDGGAARAAYRLHQGLRALDVSSQMLVRDKHSADKTAISGKTKIAQLGANLDNLPLQLYHNHSFFSPQWFPDIIVPKVAKLCPDVINLHWVCGGYLQVETLAKFNKPLVWTLHDMWAFTGGCHYSQDCIRYTDSCGACPQLNSHKNCDLSRWVWQRKAKAWKELSLTIVTPSLWLAKCAKESSLFRNLRVEVIPNGLDVKRYKPINQCIARELLNLPQDKQLVLFGATGGVTSDPRKGFNLLCSALQNLSKSGWQDKIEIVIFGSSPPENPVDLGFMTHYLGRVFDDISIVLIYSAADVMIVPSTQEAFGQTASESLACGTPVVSFDSTGLKDIVEHQKNGYRAKCFDYNDLAYGIAWVLQDENRRQALSRRAREKVEQEFTLEIQARAYFKLYQELFEAASLSSA